MVPTAQLVDTLWHTRHEHKKNTSSLRFRRSTASVLRSALSFDMKSALVSSPSLRLNAGRSRWPAWSLGKRAVSMLGAGRQAGRGQRQAVGTTAQRTSVAPAPGRGSYVGGLPASDLYGSGVCGVLLPIYSEYALYELTCAKLTTTERTWVLYKIENWSRKRQGGRGEDVCGGERSYWLENTHEVGYDDVHIHICMCIHVHVCVSMWVCICITCVCVKVL